MIRKLDKTEYALAASLALEVYIQCGAEDFDEEGLNSFKSFISSEQSGQTFPGEDTGRGTRKKYGR